MELNDRMSKKENNNLDNKHYLLILKFIIPILSIILGVLKFVVGDDLSKILFLFFSVVLSTNASIACTIQTMSMFNDEHRVMISETYKRLMVIVFSIFGYTIIEINSILANKSFFSSIVLMIIMLILTICTTICVIGLTSKEPRPDCSSLVNKTSSKIKAAKPKKRIKMNDYYYNVEGKNV